MFDIQNADRQYVFCICDQISIYLLMTSYEWHSSQIMFRFNIFDDQEKYFWAFIWLAPAWVSIVPFKKSHDAVILWCVLIY